MKFAFTQLTRVCLSVLLFTLINSISSKAQFPLFPPGNVTNTQDRDQMMYQMGISFPVLSPKLQDKSRPPLAWPVNTSAPEENWTDSFGHMIARSGFGLWNNYDDSTTGLLPGGQNGSILGGPQAWRVGSYAPIDLLKMKNGELVSTPEKWWNERRPEIAKDVAEQMWGVVPADSILPKIKYVVTTTTGGTGMSAYIQKNIAGYIDSSRYAAVRNKPRLVATLRLPANSPGPVPVLIVMYPSSQINTYWNLCLAQGFGVCTFDYTALQADNGSGLTSYLIGLCNQGNWRKPTDWGALRAWGWGVSKIIDTIRRMPGVDSTMIGLEGHSQLGKAALVAAAFDQRIAFTYASCGGSLGTSMERRHWGQDLEGSSSENEYHWMAGNFFKWMGPYYTNDSLNAMGITDSLTRSRMLYLPRKVKDMPVDAHSLVAMIAPRMIMLNGGSLDSWNDAGGESQSGIEATPVYNLLGMQGLIITDLKPKVGVGYTQGTIGYRYHTGGHTDLPDFPYFFELVKKNRRPWRQDSTILFNNISASSMTLTWTPGNGLRRVVFIKENAGLIPLPANSTLFNASTNWNVKGSQLGTSGYYCVYNGTGNAVTLSNLKATTSYKAYVFTYNGLPGKEIVLRDTTSGNPNSATTTTIASEPTNHVTNFTAAQSGNSISITWNDAIGTISPSGYVIKASTTSLASIGVTDGIEEAAGSMVRIVGQGTQTATFTNVSSNKTYYFKIFPYTNPSGTYIDYKTTVPVPSTAVTIGAISLANDYFRTKANGNWNALSTWESSPNNSTWIPSTVLPGSSAKSISIENNDTVTITSNLTLNSFTIKAGSQVTLNGGLTLTIPNGLLTKQVLVNGTIKNRGTIALGGTMSIENGGVYEQATNSAVFAAVTYQPGSTLRLTESYLGNLTLPSGAYRNVTFAGTLAPETFFTLDGTGTNSIAEKLLISQTGAGDVVISSFNNSTGLTVGSYEQTGGTVYVNRNGAGNRALTVLGNMTITDGTFDFNKTGTTGALATVNMGGNLTIGAGATFTKSNTSAGSAAVTVFNGNIPQAFTYAGTVTGPLSYAVNNAQGLTLGSDIVSDTLSLTNGNITLGSYTLTATTITGGSASSYVVTNGTGVFKRQVANSNVLFPVGTISSYSPVTMRNSGLADNFGVKVQAGFSHPVNQSDRMVNLQWDIKEDVPGNSNNTITLQWNTANQAANFTPSGPLVMGHYNGNIWEKQLVTATGSRPYMATGVNFNSFSPFVIAMDGALDNLALPITLVKLSATEQAGKAQLKWTSYNEVNLRNYAVEKSVDGVRFTSVATVNASNGVTPEDYSFAEAISGSGILFYRLKITGKDDGVTYSNIVLLNLKKTVGLSLLPNPVRNDLFITHSKAGKNSVISVMASNGVSVMNIQVPEESVQTTVNTSVLLPGTYTIRYLSNGKIESKQVIKLK